MKIARVWHLWDPTTNPHVSLAILALLLLGAVCVVDAAVTHSASLPADQPLFPAFSHPGGYYEDGFRIALTSPDPAAVIRFTLDGSLPTSTAGTRYRRPLLFDASMPTVVVVRARVVLPGGEMGPVATESYFVAVAADLPLLSLVVAPDDLWRADRGIYANYEQRGDAWERPVDVAYVDADRRSGFHVQAGVRVHGGWSRQFDKKSLRLYFRDEYGANRLDYPLFSGGAYSAAGDVQSFKRLVLHAGGQDFQDTLIRNDWTLLRNQLTAKLALTMGGFATRSQPALLFINGELWAFTKFASVPMPGSWMIITMSKPLTSSPNQTIRRRAT